MTKFSAEQLEWLAANEREWNGRKLGKWLYSDNARPFIDEMEKAGLMQPCYGEFVAAPASDPPEMINLFGKMVPLETMTGLYILTRYGKTVREQQAPEPSHNP